MANRAEAVEIRKAKQDFWMMFALAVLAGALIAAGALYATTVWTGGSALPYGVNRMLGGMVFSLGPVLVIVAGAELVTGNNLIVMAWAARKVSTGKLLRNWGSFTSAISPARCSPWGACSSRSSTCSPRDWSA
jgi:formate/nitrite transporter FocA (FNT family)